MNQFDVASSMTNALTEPFSCGCATDRFALYVVRMIDSESDLKTISRWAKHAHVSSSTLRELCRIVQIKARHARDFGRLLRAICKSGKIWRPEAVLDCADVRTLNKMMKVAGFSCRGGQTPTVRDFIKNQHWIPREHPVMPALNKFLDRSYPQFRDIPFGTATAR